MKRARSSARRAGTTSSTEDGTLSRKGVVYNEMRGAFADADELEEDAIMRALYPGHALPLCLRRRPGAHPRAHV